MEDLLHRRLSPLEPRILAIHGGEYVKCLSIDERRRILAQQAEQMKVHYEQTADERTEWQAGNFIDEY